MEWEVWGQKRQCQIGSRWAIGAQNLDGELVSSCGDMWKCLVPVHVEILGEDVHKWNLNLCLRYHEQDEGLLTTNQSIRCENLIKQSLTYVSRSRSDRRLGIFHATLQAKRSIQWEPGLGHLLHLRTADTKDHVHSTKGAQRQIWNKTNEEVSMVTSNPRQEGNK